MANADSKERIATPNTSLSKDVNFGDWSENTVQDKGWKILVYGDSGSGKTYFAGTFPDPLFLDLEDGMRSLLPLKRNIKRYPANPNKQITELSEVKEFYQLLKRYKPETAPFKTVVIDSLNELQILVLENSIKTTSAQRIYDDQPTQGDYGKLARDMQTMVRLFIKLPFNIVFLAGAKEREYAEDKILPLFLGKKTGPDVRRIIEQVGYCYTKKSSKDDGKETADHVISFADNPSFIAKDRTGKLGRPIPNTYEAMMAVVNRGKEVTP